MRFLLVVVFSAFLLLSVSSFAGERPVEAWISHKQVGNRVVEVVKIKTNTGKIYEFYPGLSPKSIPKPESRLSEGVSNKLLLVSVGFLFGIATGVAILLLKYGKLKKV